MDYKNDNIKEKAKPEVIQVESKKVEPKKAKEEVKKSACDSCLYKPGMRICKSCIENKEV